MITRARPVAILVLLASAPIAAPSWGQSSPSNPPPTPGGAAPSPGYPNPGYPGSGYPGSGYPNSGYPYGTEPYGGANPYTVAPAPRPSPVRGFLDGGYNDTLGRTAQQLEGGYTVGGGIMVTPVPSGAVDLRLDLNYSHSQATNAALAANVPSSATYARGGADIWDGTLDLQFNLGGRGGVNPYLFGGGGAYYTRYVFRSLTFAPGYGGYGGYGCDSFFGYCEGVESATREAHGVTKFGWNAGAGIEFPLDPFGTKLFIEGRYTRVLQGRGLPPLRYVPITVGVRF